jgi:PHD/YefM family antitoxin component YafN of YafNO toxin-antitoxin module
MATRIIPKTELRQRIRQELADLGDDTVVITERGRAMALVVSVGRWNEIQSTIEDLEDRLAVLEHRASRDRGRPADKVLSDVEARGTHVRSPRRKTG